MKKKILIGSIGAVAILVIVSFTGVVGYSSVKPTSGKVSPLFNIRSSKAIGKESKDLTCDYVGKGEKTNIPFSSRMRRTEQVQKAVNIISKMDDRALIKYFGRIINQKQMTDEETSDALQYIRRNPNVMKYYNTKDIPKPETGWYISCDWFPGCNILDIIIKILYTWGDFVGAIIDFFTSRLTCDTPCQSAAAPTYWPCC